MGDEYWGGRPGAGAIAPMPQGQWGRGRGWGGPPGGGWVGGQPPVYGRRYGGGGHGGGYGGRGGGDQAPPPVRAGGYGGQALPPVRAGGYGNGGGQAPAPPPVRAGGYPEYNGIDIGSQNISGREGNNVRLRFDLSKLKDMPKLSGGIRIGSGQISNDEKNNIDFSEYNDPSPPPPENRSQVQGIGVRFEGGY